MADVPRPDSPAIDFTLPDGNQRPVRLSSFRGCNVVLAFYPADWSPVCTSELTLIQEVYDQIRGYHAEVIAVSCDGPYSHRAWAENQHLNFPLLSDFWPHGAVAREYGVFLEQDGIANRAMFFIDPAGILRSTWIAPSPDIAPGLNIIFDALDEMTAHSGEPSHV